MCNSYQAALQKPDGQLETPDKGQGLIFLSTPTGNDLQIGKEVLSEASAIWARLVNGKDPLQNVPFATSYSRIHDCTGMLKHYWSLLLVLIQLNNPLLKRYCSQL